MKSQFITRSLQALALLGCAASAQAMGSAAGVASEFTQVANNIELTASVAKQAEMVTEQIRTKVVQIEQLATMTRNLQRLASGDVESALAPHRQQLGAYNSMLNSVIGIKHSAMRASAVLGSRQEEFARLGFKDPSKYLSYEFGLAKTRGGDYRARLMQDISALEAMQASHAEFARVSAETASITGNLQGLQKLSQLSSMATGELMQLRAAVVAQNVDAAAEKQASSSNTGHRQAVYDATRKAAEKRSYEAAPTGFSADPKKAWGHLSQ
jgi:type IV secretion system protein TrbJ